MKPDDHLDNLLRRRAEPAAPAGGDLCADPELLAAYAENALDGAAREAFEIHLAICTPCRESVASLVRIAPRETPVAAAESSKWWRLVWAAPIAATALLFLILRSSPLGAPSGKGGSVSVADNRAPAALPEERRAEPAASEKKPASKGETFGRGETSGPVSKAAPQTAPAPREFNDRSELKQAPLGGLPASISQTPAGRGRFAPSPPRAEASPPPPMRAQAETRDALSALTDKKENKALDAAKDSALADRQVLQRAQQPTQQLSQQQVAVAPYVANQNQALDQGAAARLREAAPTSTFAGSPAAPRMLAKAKAPSEIPVRIDKKGVLSISIDAGLNWQELKTPEPVASANFTDPLNGEIRTVKKHVFRTVDGGKTWDNR